MTCQNNLQNDKKTIKEIPQKPVAKNISQAAEDGKQLLDFLEKKKGALSPLLIMTHDFPDPDAIATAISLQYLCEKLYGIRSRIVYRGIIGRVENRAMVSLLKIAIHKLRPSDIRNYKNVALIDTQPEFENNPYPRNRKVSMVIDQHPYVKKSDSELSIIDVDCGATSVILTQALLLSGIEIPKKIATALVYGILSDTMGLYRAKRSDIIQTYLAILPMCDMRSLIRIQHPPKTKKFFSALRRGLHEARSFRNVIFSHLGVVQHPDLVSEIADFLLTYKGVSRSLCTGRYKGKLHVSLRSNRLTDDTPEILRAIFENPKEAGGHDMVAGGSFHVIGADKDEINWIKAEDALIKKMMRKFRLPAKAEFSKPFYQADPAVPAVAVDASKQV